MCVDGGGWYRDCLLGRLRVCVCIVGVEADSRIPFALVSVGLDQV